MKKQPQFGDRLLIAIGRQSLRAFSQKTGATEGLLRKYLKHQTLPGLEKLLAISQASGYRVEWLATGQGPQQGQSTEPDNLPSPEPLVMQYQMRPGPETLIQSGSLTGLWAKAFRRVYLPGGKEARPQDLLLLEVDDDAMAPTFSPGDEVLIDRTLASGPLRDGVYLLRVGGALALRRVQLAPNRALRLISDHPAYAMDVIEPGPHAPPWAVLGRVIWHARKI